MTTENNDILIGDLSISFKPPTNPLRSSTNETRKPRFENNTLIIPNDKEIKVTAFANSQTCLITSGMLTFGDSSTEVLWCGSTAKGNFCYKFTNRAKACVRHSATAPILETFLNLVKPKRTRLIEDKKGSGKPFVYGTTWFTKIPNNRGVKIGAELVTNLIRPDQDKSNGLNLAGEVPYLIDVKIFSRPGIAEFKLNGVWFAIGTDIILDGPQHLERKELAGTYLIEPSKYQFRCGIAS
ncbi:MAG TPA: hypothetical protein VHQ20_00825 [Patescibacteria group bacterium]|nr:hypothetical protein [Patescibacteria group bacterium]